MDNFRLILFMVFAFLSLMLYQQWQADYAQTVEPSSVTSRATPQGSADSTNTSVGKEQAELPIARSHADSAELPGSAGRQNNLLLSSGRIQVETDVLRLEIDRQGGDLRILELLKYPLHAEKPEEPLRFMNDRLPHIFVLQSGLLSQQPTATHQSLYQSEQSSYSLGANEEQLEVVLRWEMPADSDTDSSAAVSIEKIYRFKRGSYALDVEYRIQNHRQEAWNGRLYGQLQRTQIAEAGQSSFIYTYMGGAIGSPVNSYNKISFDEIKGGGANAYVAADSSVISTLQEPWNSGWLAMLQHYFVAAIIPDKTQAHYYYSKYLNDGSRYVLGLYGPDVSIKAGEQEQLTFQFYAGPKIQDDLAELATGLELTVDYGFLWFIAQPLFWVLKFIHDLVGNWGWAIILLTILIKLAFFQLSATSYKSMANMRRLHPRLLQLKERYANDKGGLNQAMMDLYKKEKINPLGGCLPILVQIPVFIALYWVLLESVELRQASFVLWLNNLSEPDPYFVLPLVMGATMLLQHKLNPAPLDPMQEKVMMMLPIIFTVFFAFFPAGLVLYWTVNNILSIGQQWYITRKIAGDV